MNLNVPLEPALHYLEIVRDGIEREPDARNLYEAVSGEIVEQAGFILHPTIEYFGGTPDGLIRSNVHVPRTAQIKCPTLDTYVAWVRAGVIPEEHKPQMIAEIACTRAILPNCNSATFIAYNPDMPERLQLMVRPFEPSAEEIKAVEDAAIQFLKELDALFDDMNKRQVA